MKIGKILTIVALLLLWYSLLMNPEDYPYRGVVEVFTSLASAYLVTSIICQYTIYKSKNDIKFK